MAVAELPKYASPIVGRARELADASELLLQTRLVTLAGPGGIGKTRLAAEVASNLSDPWRTNVTFVDLAPITEPSLVAAAAARALGIEVREGGDALHALVQALENVHAAIVLDNCENASAPSAQLTEALVAGCPNVLVLATSREPLAASGESVYRLRPLNEESSLALFIGHARQFDPNFEPSERDEPLLRDICRRLDGMALAIQLAAAHVHLMPLGQLRSRLDGHFRLIVSGNRAADTPARHQTMDALIGWTHDVLSSVDRSVFARLGAFNGSFTAEAAVSVAAGKALEPADVTRALDSLVDKSMIERLAGERFRLLEPIRQYALDRLQAAGEEPHARRAFATYFAKRSGEIAANFGFGSQDDWLARLRPDLDNYRAAMVWAHDRDVALASQMAASLADFWMHDNLTSEGLRRSEAVLAAVHHPDDVSALPLLLAVAKLCMASHVYWRSLELSGKALPLAAKSGDPAAVAEAQRIDARSRLMLGIDDERTLTELRQSTHAIRAQGNPYLAVRALTDYALALIDRGRTEEGHKLLLEATELAPTVDWPHLNAHIAINIAELEFRTGRTGEAIARSRAAIAMLREHGSVAQLAHVHANLTAYLAVAGDYDEAIAVAREAADLARSRDMHFPIAWAMQSIGIVLAARGDATAGAQLLGYTDGYVERSGTKREPAELIVQEHLLKMLRSALSEETLAQELARGRDLTEEAALRLALAVSPRAVARGDSQL